jgi:phosphoglycerate dehydrogenase-like enzyme
LIFCRQLRRQIKSPQRKTAKIMQDREPKDPVKIGIMGCGRLGSQLAHCLLTYGGVKPKDIKVSTRRPETLGIDTTQ